MTFNACGCVVSGNESSPNAYPSTFTGKAVLVRKRTGWRGSTASQCGQHEEANESVANAKAIARYLGDHVIVDNCLAAAEEEIAFNAGRVEDATTVAEQAVTFDQSVGGIFDARLAQRTSGQTLVAFDPPRWDAAKAHLAESLRLFEEREARLEAARTSRGAASLVRATTSPTYANTMETHWRSLRRRNCERGVPGA